MVSFSLALTVAEYLHKLDLKHKVTQKRESYALIKFSTTNFTLYNRSWQYKKKITTCYLFDTQYYSKLQPHLSSFIKIN